MYVDMLLRQFPIILGFFQLRPNVDIKHDTRNWWRRIFRPDQQLRCCRLVRCRLGSYDATCVCVHYVRFITTQHLQNAFLRLILDLNMRDHVTQGQLPIHWRMQFKLCMSMTDWRRLEFNTSLLVNPVFCSNRFVSGVLNFTLLWFATGDISQSWKITFYPFSFTCCFLSVRFTVSLLPYGSLKWCNVKSDTLEKLSN